MTNVETYFGVGEIDGVRTRGNPDAFRGKAIVAFIDLLGFSASIRDHWCDENDSPLEKLLRIKDTAGATRETTLAFGDTKTAPPRVTEAYRSRIHTVSDSILVCNALPPDLTGKIFLRSLWAVFTSIQFIWESASTEGYTIRGAIELGDIYWTAAETIGPAYLDAHCLESKVSQFSRVLVGPQLLEAAVQSTDSHSNQLGGVLAVSPDKLIELAPFRLLGGDSRVQNLQRFEKMQNAAQSAKNKEKYDYLLSLLRDQRKIKWASHDDLKSGIQPLAEQIKQKCPRRDE